MHQRKGDIMKKTIKKPIKLIVKKTTGWRALAFLLVGILIIPTAGTAARMSPTKALSRGYCVFTTRLFVIKTTLICI